MVSYYQSTSNNHYYYLHREFVTSQAAASSDGQDTEHATLCLPCYEAAIHGRKIPILSLAAGVDFGNADRIFLPTLTLAEEYVIATARLFVLIIKLSGYQHGERQSGKLGHAIVFPQYGPQLETEIRKARIQRHTGIFPCLDNIYDTISIAFVGSDLQWAAMAVNKSHRAFKPIRVRSAVIYMWLAALKACNSRYRDITIDDSEEMTATLESIPNQLIQKATVVGDKCEIEIDRLVHEQIPQPVNDDDQDKLIEENPTGYPMSFLTRSGDPKTNNTSATAIAFQSNFHVICFFFTHEHCITKSFFLITLRYRRVHRRIKQPSRRPSYSARNSHRFPSGRIIRSRAKLHRHRTKCGTYQRI